jgi:hypothetical protein
VEERKGYLDGFSSQCAIKMVPACFGLHDAIDPTIEPKYLEPPDTEVKVKKEEVIFAPSWKLSNRPTLVVEGSFCAMALFECASVFYRPKGLCFTRTKPSRLSDLDTHHLALRS